MSPVPVDPYPNFVPNTLAQADQVDARIKKLYDTLDPAVSGVDYTNVRTGGLWDASAAGLPAGPRDGQEYDFLADAANDVIWSLRYRAATGKWAFKGGTPMYAQAASAGAAISGSTYVVFAASPTITVPRSGTYRIMFGGSGNFATAGVTAYLAPSGAGLTAVDVNALGFQEMGAGYDPGSRECRGVLTAGGSLLLSARNLGAGGFSVLNPWIALLPVSIT